MPGIRLYPNYHGYTLADPIFAELTADVAERNLILQIALSIEDTRTQSTIIEPVDPAPLADLLPRLPQLRVVLLNFGGWTDDDAGEKIAKIRSADNAHFDIAIGRSNEVDRG